MTIILSTKRHDLAVLAADQLIGSQTGPRIYARKVYLHTTLPLAFAVGGCMWLPAGGQDAPALNHVAQFATAIVHEDQLVLADLADLLRRFLQPGMDHMRDTIQIFIALVKNGNADVGVQQVGGAGVAGASTQFWHSCEAVVPPYIQPFYDQSAFPAFLHDLSVTDPVIVSQRARSIVQQCIDQERTLHPDGQNRVIGGSIEVVLVRPTTPAVLV